jgi:hypothetical protein
MTVLQICASSNCLCYFISTHLSYYVVNFYNVNTNYMNLMNPQEYDVQQFGLYIQKFVISLFS